MSGKQVAVVKHSFVSLLLQKPQARLYNVYNKRLSVCCKCGHSLLEIVTRCRGHAATGICSENLMTRLACCTGEEMERGYKRPQVTDVCSNLQDTP